MRSFKSINLFAVFILATAVLACEGCQNVGAVYREADQEALEGFKPDFRYYLLRDESLSEEEKSEYKVVLEQWREEGSTPDTYNTLAPLYKALYSADSDLTETEKSSRDRFLTSWRENVSSRHPDQDLWSF